MKRNGAIFIIGLLIWNIGAAQNIQSINADPENWTAFNRNVEFKKHEIQLDARVNDGVLWLNDVK